MRSLHELRRRTSDLRGLADIRLVVVENGPGRGQRLLICRNAAGLSFEVAADRGFDISALTFRGINVGWNAPVGFAAPSFPADLDRGLGLLRHFDGFLVTCGLDHYGKPAEGPAQHFAYVLRERVSYPLHGRISGQSATIVGYGISEDASPVIWCEAEVMQAAVFGEVLVLRRRIELSLFDARLALSDVVVNRGFRPARHALLYHFNIGYPFLDEGSELIGEFGELKDRFRATPPVPKDDAEEQVDTLEPAGDDQGFVTVGVQNRALLRGIALDIRFRRTQLPQLALWRCWQSGLYVLGIEPCTGTDPSAVAYEGGQTLHFLGPGEGRRYDLTLAVTEG